MMGEQVDAAEQRRRRWLAWYHDGCPADCQPNPAAEWPDLDEGGEDDDEGESKAEYIVRCDVPAMRDEIDRLTQLVAEAERRGAVKALRDAARSAGEQRGRPYRWLNERADAILNGDL